MEISNKEVNLILKKSEISGFVKNIRPEGNKIFPYIPGEYRIELEDGQLYSIKDSSKIPGSFIFEKDEVIKSHLDYYFKLKEINFFSDDTNFISFRDKGIYKIISISSSLRTLISSNNRLINFPEDQFIQQRKNLESIIPEEHLHGDAKIRANYGVTNSWILYYNQLPIFKDIPSSLIYNNNNNNNK